MKSQAITIYAGTARAGNSLETDPGELFFVINRDKHTASELAGFSSFEQVREAFRWGFMMPDGCMANGIGRCKDKADFLAKAKHGNWAVLE